jgi:hypothetical protein
MPLVEIEEGAHKVVIVSVVASAGLADQPSYQPKATGKFCPTAASLSMDIDAVFQRA